MEAHENSQVGIGASPPKRGRLRDQKESSYSSACNMGNKQEGLEAAAVQQENCCHHGDTVG